MNSDQESARGLRWPSTTAPGFRPDAVVTRAAGQQRRRRAMLGATAVAVVIAAGAITASTVLHDNGAGPLQPADGKPTSHTQPQKKSKPIAWPPPGAKPKKNYSGADLDGAAQRLHQYLLQHFTDLVPGASQVSVEAAGHELGSDDAVDDTVEYTKGGNKYSMVFSLTAAGDPGNDPNTWCANDKSGPGISCTVTAGANGGATGVFSETFTTDGTSKQSHTVAVADFRQDGSVVSVMGDNFDRNGSNVPNGDGAMPISNDQLIAISRNAGLHM